MPSYCLKFFALSGQWYEARGLLQMSHLQDNIQNMEIAVQILFNCVLVQLGLCAVQHNKVEDAHNCLELERVEVDIVNLWWKMEKLRIYSQDNAII